MQDGISGRMHELVLDCYTASVQEFFNFANFEVFQSKMQVMKQKESCVASSETS